MGNREALLEGALGALKEKGYAHTTARDVAGRAGTSLAAIGYHYDSLEQLLHEAIAEAFRRWRTRISDVVAAHGARPVEEVLPLLAEELDTLCETDRPLLVGFLEAVAVAERSPRVRERVATLYREERAGTAAIIRALRGEDRGDEDVMAALVLAVVDGVIVQTLVNPDDAPKPSMFLSLLGPLVIGTPVTT